MSAPRPRTIHLNSKDSAAREDLNRKVEILESMQDFAGQTVDQLLLTVEKSWQPSDLLPDSTREAWPDEIAALRVEARALPDDVLVALVGDMVTEEALPSYQTMLMRFEGAQDPTGASDSPWARWSRLWTAEENRHGDLLNRFLYLVGRVDMRAVEVTIQYLIRNGFDFGMDGDPYRGFVYTSFQERATRISHANVAQLAGEAGCPTLQRICRQIAGDEGRHEEAYKRFMDRIFEIDPAAAIIAFRDMMKHTIVMPARLMEDGQDPDLFEKFELVAQRLGVYTAHDYTDIIEHLVERWRIGALSGLSGEAAKAQDTLCGLATRYRKLARRIERQLERQQQALTFSWVFNRAV